MDLEISSQKQRRDYEWVKSRHEDNIQQLKDQKKIYERASRRRSRSGSREMDRTSQRINEKERHYGSHERDRRRRS
ncbi:unnamed protein product [Callosobruchus maculatus]|uniref:Uncharacterized protein n=1 Tax=Callosobruchus maculatus TaxID=64391 RepID=A0A653DQJ8_CALMS|nr:unnamed protein product [Callosobruchus maculatus]